MRLIDTNSAQSNHATGQQRAIANAAKSHAPPKGCTFKTKDEKEIWEYVMRTRAFDDWSPADLLTAVKVTKLEHIIRKCSKRLDQLIEDGSDPCMPDSAANDYANNLAKFERQQLTFMRSLGFTHTNVRSESGTTNKRAKAERDAADAMGGGAPSFLASA